MCRSNTGSEIYDLAWSPDGLFFITGSMDNVARIYNASTGKQAELYSHSHLEADTKQDKLFARSRSTITMCKASHGIR